MDIKIRVSIIMPSLNAAKYIGEAIGSVLSQTLEEIELKETGLFDLYRDVYVMRCFGEYYGNLGRLASKDKQKFMRRFSDDFHDMEDKGELDLSAFDEWRASQLKEIMRDSDFYWESRIKPYDEAYDEAEKYEEIIIYGAASVGWQALHALLGRGKGGNIVCFAVTKLRPGMNSVYGYEVKCIDTLKEYTDRSALMIAAKVRYKADMRRKAEELGFRHIIEMPDDAG